MASLSERSVPRAGEPVPRSAANVGSPPQQAKKVGDFPFASPPSRVGFSRRNMIGAEEAIWNDYETCGVVVRYVPKRENVNKNGIEIGVERNGKNDDGRAGADGGPGNERTFDYPKNGTENVCGAESHGRVIYETSGTNEMVIVGSSARRRVKNYHPFCAGSGSSTENNALGRLYSSSCHDPSGICIGTK